MTTATAATCGATKEDGGTCASDIGLCPRCARCFAHCSHRQEAFQASRRKGGETTARKHKAGRKDSNVKTVDPDALPFDHPPRTIDEVHQWLAWVSYAGLTGIVDKDTAGKVAYSLDKCRIAMERGERMDDRLKAIEQKLKDRGRT